MSFKNWDKGLGLSCRKSETRVEIIAEKIENLLIMLIRSIVEKRQGMFGHKL